MIGLRQFFFRILIGNFSSKLFLLLADGVALYALNKSDFGAFVFLQGLIISGAVISVWGGDQALINIVGKAHEARYDVRGYLRSTRHRIGLISIIVAISAVFVAMFANVAISPAALTMTAFILVIEAQLILTAAVLRTRTRAYQAVLYLDGLRHAFLLITATALLIQDLPFEVLLIGWVIAAMLSLVLGQRALSREDLMADELDIPISDRIRASGIARFGGLWSVIQLVISRVVIFASAYLLTPEELGIVAFFIKAMTSFTFLQTVLVQTLAPSIGQLSSSDKLSEARWIYGITTFLLAATVAPAIGLFLLAIEPVKTFFSVVWEGDDRVIVFLLFTQAFNIGTGIIGQFIIHFGYIRALVAISATFALLQVGLLVFLGQSKSIEGVLLSYAIANVFLVIVKNGFAALRMGLHGFGPFNLGAIFCTIGTYFFMWDAPPEFAALLQYSLICVCWIITSALLYPDMRRVLTSSHNRGSKN